MPKRPALATFLPTIRSLRDLGHSWEFVAQSIGFTARAVYACGQAAGLTGPSAPHPHHWTLSEAMVVWEGCLAHLPYSDMAEALACSDARIRHLCTCLGITNGLTPHQARMVKAAAQAKPTKPTTLPARNCQSCTHPFTPTSRHLFRCDPCKVDGLGQEGWGIGRNGFRRAAHAGT